MKKFKESREIDLIDRLNGIKRKDSLEKMFVIKKKRKNWLGSPSSTGVSDNSFSI